METQVDVKNFENENLMKICFNNFWYVESWMSRKNLNWLFLMRNDFTFDVKSFRRERTHSFPTTFHSNIIVGNGIFSSVYVQHSQLEEFFLKEIGFLSLKIAFVR